jgi:gliding motility-associated-like protein
VNLTPKHILVSILLLAFFNGQAQDFSANNWLFSNNNRALLFGKDPGAEPIIDRGKVPQSNPGEKITINDPISGDLIAYSDGINIYDPSHNVMDNGNGILTDSDGLQAMAVSPVPGVGANGQYYLFHRNDAGQILATIIDKNLQGNAGSGPPLGRVILKNFDLGVTARGDGMLTLSNATGDTFWLVTQEENGGMFEIFEIPVAGLPLTSVGLTNLTTNVFTGSLSYHNETGQIAVVPTNEANIQILSFNPAVPEITFDRSVLNSFVFNETFGGTAGWSLSGDYVYFSRNSASEGNVFRYNVQADSITAIETVLASPVAESFSLKIAPDSSIYHLYRGSAGGNILLGRLNNASDSILAQVEIEGQLLDAENFESEYFASFIPRESVQPQITVMAQMDGLCMNNPIQFYPIIQPDNAIPSSIFWDFQPVNIQSGSNSPILSFEEAGPISFTATAIINGDTIMSNTGMVMIEENDLQVDLPDTTICPGEVLELDAEPQSGGQGQQGGASGGPYTYLWNTGETTSSIEVSEAGNYWVVVTPQTGCPVYATNEVRVYGEDNRTANIWYFGEGVGIDFNEVDGLDPPPRSITSAHAMNAPNGTSTISDQNGEVLFYSNGSTVWNRENAVMPNGTDIGGDSLSTQSVIIIPFVDDNTLYYVFTTEQVYGANTYQLKYSVVDMKEDDGRGDVVIKDIVLFTRSTERLAALEGGNGYWLLAHEYGNNTFRAYLISENGIGTPVISSAGSVHSINDPLSGQAGMKFSNGGDRVAVALIEGQDDFVEVFSFDQQTGEITDLEYTIDLNDGGPGNDEVYDVHFSLGGDKLYATMNNRNTGSAGGRIIEYRVDTASTDATRLASRTNIAQGINGTNFGQIQTGPDGQLYVAAEDQAYVGGIIANEDTLVASAYNEQQVLLTTGTTKLGLPNFVQNNATTLLQAGLVADTLVCVDQPIGMSGTGTSDIDQLIFSITNTLDNSTVFSATGIETLDTSYVFSPGQGGLYNLSLNISNRCGFDSTIVQPLEVLNIPDPPTVPQALAICEPGVPLDAAQGIDPTGLTFEWTDSQGNVVSTDQTYTILTPDIYTVTTFNQLGCSSSAEVFAGPPFEIQLPPTAVICEGTDLTLDPQLTANNYIWTVINPDNTTTTLPNQRRATVDSSTPGVYSYVVSIEDPISMGCFVNDTTIVTINPLAQATITPIPSTCGNADGEFTFDVTTTGSYSYTVTGGTPSTGTITGPGTQTITGLAAGSYNLTLTDNASGCAQNFDALISDNSPGFNITAVANNVDCSNPANVGSITVTSDVDVFPVDYVLTNTADNSTIVGTANPAGLTFDILNVPEGTYNLVVTDQGSSCNATSANLVVSIASPVEFTTNPFVELCAPNATLSVSPTTPGATFAWTGPGGFSESGTSVTATQSGTYTVTGTAAGFCETVETIELSLSIQPTIILLPPVDNCDGTITLTAEITNAQAGASYIYNWNSGQTTASITVSQAGTYSVTARNAENLTCVSNEPVTQIAPSTPIEVGITQSPACDDGADIVLNANILSGSPSTLDWVFNGQNIGIGQTITVTEEGDYTLIATDGLVVCSVEARMSVRRQITPEGQLPEVDYYCPTRSDNPVLYAGGGFATYEWTLDGVPYPQADDFLVVEAPGEYIVTMTTPIGCVQMDTVNIVESCDPEVVAPNAFSPTSVAPNNAFSVFPNDFVADFEIYIYSRWGELIYQSNTLEFKWDGTFNGELVPIGTYPYVMKFRSRFEPERGVFEQKGAVTVIR